MLDAEAMIAAAGCHQELHTLRTCSVLTPHAGEMAGLLQMDKDAVTGDPVGTARRAAEHFRAVVSLKGS